MRLIPCEAIILVNLTSEKEGDKVKVLVLLAGAVWACFASQANGQAGAFSRSELAAMGLSSVQVVSEVEASTVRVYGSYPSRWGNAYPFVKGVNRLEQRDIRVQRPLYPLRSSVLVQMRYSRRR